MSASPFNEGDRVEVTRHGKLGNYPALVLRSKRDAFGWDVEVMPEHDAPARWVGSDQLTMIRKDGE